MPDRTEVCALQCIAALTLASLRIPRVNRRCGRSFVSCLVYRFGERARRQLAAIHRQCCLGRTVLGISSECTWLLSQCAMALQLQ